MRARVHAPGPEKGREIERVERERGRREREKEKRERGGGSERASERMGPYKDSDQTKHQAKQ